MLILEVKVQGRIMVGDDTVVTVLGAGSNAARLGVTAPKHVEVDREEIRARKKADIDGTRKVKPD